jgi:hypothetical protein
MRLVTYRRNDRASKTTCKYGTFLSFFLALEPVIRPGRYGPNTCPVTAFSNPLYLAISAVPCQRMNLSVETGRFGVHLFDANDFAIDLNISY